MDWKRAMEEERAALKRIVALLFALAGLADLACGRSRAVRGFVLWLLRQAEIVAQDFVGGVPDAPPASTQLGPAGSSRTEAMRLAESFRALTRQLDRQARLAFRGADRGDTGPLSFGPAMLGLLDVLSALAALAGRAPHPPLAPDTS